ncbi:MAG: hypothetical protein ABEH66_03165 [Halobacteriales archaeon]
MSAEDGGHLPAAVAALANRDYEAGGDTYTRAAWRGLAEPREGQGPFDADEKGWVGGALGRLATAAVAYRVAGRTSRAKRRGVEGVAIARDLGSALDHPLQAACLDEFVADFRAVGGLDDPEEAYREAAGAYRDAADGIEDPRAWATTPLFEGAAATIRQVARGLADGEIAVGWEDLHGDDPGDPEAFLARRTTYKRQRFPGLIERAVGEGHLAAPRGTTAYDTDAYRCPKCGSTDVNWVADNTLCLRCSAPVERR